MKIEWKIVLFFLLSIVGFLPAGAQDVRISIFYDQLTEAFTFHCIRGEYMIMSENREIFTVKKGGILFLERTEDKIRLSDNSGIRGEYSSLTFRDLLLKGKFMLKSVKPVSEQRLYKGDLFAGIKHGALEIINETGFSHYLAGVVKAEAGPGAPSEFFKVQAILCRTYAVKNWLRHADEGFHLCDDTHCQVYHGTADDNPGIFNAVMSTHNVVIADENYNLISAAYHSNSGGETQKAEKIWPGEHDYLMAIVDPFSVDQPGHRWVERIPVETWKSYLSTRGIEHEEFTDDEILIRQDHRKIFFEINGDTLNIREIREDFGLRSSFFNMRTEGEEIIFEGKGYGHGIGLSQEGAMEMARQGYSYMDILHFYYFNVQVKNINELPASSLPSVFR